MKARQDLLTPHIDHLEKLSMMDWEFLYSICIGKTATTGRLFSRLQYPAQEYSREEIVRLNQCEHIQTIADQIVTIVSQSLEWKTLNSKIPLYDPESYLNMETQNKLSIIVNGITKSSIENLMKDGFNQYWDIFKNAKNLTGFADGYDDIQKEALKKFVFDAIVFNILGYVFPQVVIQLDKQLKEKTSSISTLFPAPKKEDLDQGEKSTCGIM